MLNLIKMDKDLSDLIHDTNSSLGKITRSVEYFSIWLKDNAKQLDSIGVDVSKPHVCLEYIKSSKKEIQESIDLFYKQKSKE